MCPSQPATKMATPATCWVNLESKMKATARSLRIALALSTLAIGSAQAASSPCVSGFLFGAMASPSCAQPADGKPEAKVEGKIDAKSEQPAEALKAAPEAKTSCPLGSTQRGCGMPSLGSNEGLPGGLSEKVGGMMGEMMSNGMRMASGMMGSMFNGR